MKGSVNGNRYILTMIDTFTKFGFAAPLPNKSGETVTHALSTMLLSIGWMPECLVVDRGTEFDNKFLKEWVENIDCKLELSKGYEVRTKGAIERFNRTLENILRKTVVVPTEWDGRLAYAVFSYNCQTHGRTGE